MAAERKVNSSPTLWRNRNFRLLFSAQIISLLGSGVTTVALALFIYQLTGGASATGIIGNALMLRILAFLLFSQPAGVLADRLNRKKMLIAADLIRFLLLALFPFITAIWQVYVLIFSINAKQPSGTTNESHAPRIEFRDVSLAYDDQRVLDHLSLTVAPGEMKLMLGESGGGKSTIIKLVLGLEKPDSGEIFVDGEEVTRLPEEDLDRIRKKMGVVFQEGALFDSLSVFENVAYRLHERGEDEETVECKVEEILEFVGLKGVEDKLPSELSGGMKRRVGFRAPQRAQASANTG